MRWGPRFTNVSCGLALLGCTPTGAGKQAQAEREAGEQPTVEPTPAPNEPASNRLAAFVPTRYRITGGQYHTCAIRDGAIYCWGANSKGQLGDRSQVDRPRPVPVIGISDATSVVAGDQHTCALRVDGSVRCWGNDEDGEVTGEPGGVHIEPVVPAGIGGPGAATSIEASDDVSCLVERQAEVRCWGRVAWTGTTIDFASLAGVDVGVGDHTICALTRDGHVDCRGPNYYGELGVLELERDAARVAGLERATMLSVGSAHACALVGEGGLACWGSGVARQTGTGFERGIPASRTNTTVEINRPNLERLPPLRQVAAGFHHTCVLAQDGRVGCFGSNDEEQSMPGIDRDQNPEVYWLPELDDAVEITAGVWHSCALRAGGEVLCWGDDSRGQLGGGALREIDEAVGLMRVDDPATEAPGELTKLALADTCSFDFGVVGGELWCRAGGPWQTGDERVVERTESCLRTESGEVWCGDDRIEQGEQTIERLGRGGRYFVLRGGALARWDYDHLEIVLAGGVSRVAIEGTTVCFADADGRPACFSERADADGQLARLHRITNVVDVEQLAVTWDSACALTRADDVKCWGFGGKAAWQARTMRGLPPVASITAMQRHVCAVTKSGQVWCWGRNYQGELGDGTTGDRDNPVEVLGIPESVAVEGEDIYTCARAKRGELWCWGEHPYADTDSDDLRASVGETSGVVTVVGLP